MRKSNGSTLNNSRGQVVVEYLLLIVVVVVVYVTIMNTLTKRDPGGDPDNSGFIIKAWSSMLTTIGQDYADDVGP